MTASESPYWDLFQRNPHPIFIFDTETRRCVAANDAAIASYGYTREELLAMTVSDLRPDAQENERFNEVFTALASEPEAGPRTFPGPWRHKKKDGSVIDVEIWRMRLMHGGRRAFLAMAVDITERKRAEEDLRASEERYRALFDASPIPMFVYDTETLGYLAVNETAVRAYGWSREEFMKMTLLDVRPPEDHARLRAAAASLPAQGGAIGVWRHCRRDGSIFPVEITTHPLTFAGRTARLVAAQDVSARLALEEQLRQSQKMEAIGLLAGGVAHDFNNLLGIILGAAELARRSLAQGRGGAEAHLDAIATAGQRAADLTRKLLAFSRKQVLRFETRDLQEALDDFTSLLQRIVGEDVEVVVKRASSRVLVRVDAAQLEQVLLNLCTNARQAMPKGGTLTFEVARAAIDDAFVARNAAFGARRGHFGELRVIDSGVGMSRETLARLFEPFFTTKREGTGLGLAMVYGIVQQHHGMVTVESEPDRGTTFRVFLPLAEPAARNPTPYPPRVAANLVGGNETILVAEDEHALRVTITRMLEGLGYTVVAASNGEEAVRELQARAGAVDLVLLDVVMPKVGGVAAFRRMKEAVPGVRVIFTSGYAAESGELRELVQDGHVLLDKPFKLDDLARVIRAALDAP